MSYETASRTEWSNDDTKAGRWPGHEVIRTGALQRIADAVEVMSRKYTELLRECELLRQYRKADREYVERMRRTIAGLRGALTKAKRRRGK